MDPLAHVVENDPILAVPEYEIGSIGTNPRDCPFTKTRSCPSPITNRMYCDASPGFHWTPASVVPTPFTCTRTAVLLTDLICRLNPSDRKTRSSGHQMPDGLTTAMLISPAVVGHPSVLIVCTSASHVTGASPPQH